MKKLIVVGVLLCAIVALGFIRVGSGVASEESGPRPVPAIDLSGISDAKPSKPINVLFIHHSCGGQMFGDLGPAEPMNGVPAEQELWKTHPRGGGGRRALEAQGYVIHEASYDSKVGEKTDLFDWLPKFTSQMDEVKRVAFQDELLPEGERNQVVIFKSCYPQNDFVADGEEPGNPAGPDLTVANAKATLTALREVLAKHEDTLFIYVTAPPRSPNVGYRERAWRWAFNKARGKPLYSEMRAEQARRARAFNTWVVSEWLKGYAGKNLLVFDKYDLLTDAGKSNLLRYPSEDDHPTSEGNKKVAAALVPFLNRAVRRAGLTD